MSTNNMISSDIIHIHINVNISWIPTPGVGIGMVFISSILAVGFYFNKRRALANGIASSGSGIGIFLYAPLCIYLQVSPLNITQLCTCIYV